MQYDQLNYIPEEQDPSITIETRDLIMKIIDNTGLSLTENTDTKAAFSKYGTNGLVPFSHHLGYHGIRTLYDKTERRNIVVPFASSLNLQGAVLEGIESDPVDERAWAGMARGWPIRMEARGDGTILILDPLPKSQISYSIEFQPAEPDGIDFSIRFSLAKKPAEGPVQLKGSWPCYMNAYDDVRFHYPQGSAEDWQWASLGEQPDRVVGESVGFTFLDDYYTVENQAFPMGYGRIGDYAMTLMFDDPSVQFFVITSGGHTPTSSVQNPAWDFSWTVDDYPLNEEIGFNGRMTYSPFKGEDKIMQGYNDWINKK
ncbi:MAG: hypothetical protein HRT89_05970 [Lentisphaeria bacterium]|nr:hypothetical protein [Lentisphaeria bacterium]NQZ67599.1 hypothetical protein [Lentisphaeria bacterium]